LVPNGILAKLASKMMAGLADLKCSPFLEVKLWGVAQICP
jgi:hypothetical protein